MGNEKMLKTQISAKGMQISVLFDSGYDDYVSLTDMAGYKSENSATTIQNWMRQK